MTVDAETVLDEMAAEIGSLARRLAIAQATVKQLQRELAAARAAAPSAGPPPEWTQ